MFYIDINQEPADIRLKVHEAQIQQLHKQTWIGIAGNFIIASSVCAALWQVISHRMLILWLGLFTLIFLFRGIMSTVFHRISPEGTDIYKWGRLHAFGAGCSGFMWAVASICLWPVDSPVHQLVLPICIVALSAGAIAVFSMWTPSYLSFFVLSVVPLSFRLIFEGGLVHVILGLLGLFFTTFLAKTGSVMHAASLRSLVTSIRNKALNVQLMHEISERKQSQKELRDKNKTLEELNNQLTTTKDSLESTNKELEKALSEVKTLRGILPICSHCKKIRDDRGAWQVLEAYVHKHSDAEFSHGICPECMKKHYPNVDMAKN